MSGLGDVVFGIGCAVAAVVAASSIAVVVAVRRTPAPLGVAMLAVAVAHGSLAFAGVAVLTSGFRPWPGTFTATELAFRWALSSPVFAAIYGVSRFVADRLGTRRGVAIGTALAAAQTGLLVMGALANRKPHVDGRFLAVGVTDGASYALTDRGQLIDLAGATAIAGRYRRVVASGTAAIAEETGGALVLLRGRGKPAISLAVERTPIRALAVGYQRVCIADADGRVVCFPLTLERSLATDDTASGVGAPELVPELDDARHVAVLGGDVCASDGRGVLRCASAAGATTVATDAKALAATNDTLCWLDARATVSCQRRKDLAEVPELDRVVRPAGESPIAELSAGRGHVCARTTSNEVLCWGSNGWHQLAQPNVDGGSPLKAVAVPLPHPTSALFAFGRSTCARDSDGNFTCWGAMPEPATLFWNRRCDRRLIARDVWCADTPEQVSLPTRFVPARTGS